MHEDRQGQVRCDFKTGYANKTQAHINTHTHAVAFYLVVL